MKEKISVGFQLTKIRTAEFAIIKEGYNVELSDDTPIAVDLEISYSVHSPEHNTIACSVEICLKQDKQLPFLKIKLDCFFDIKKDQWDVLLINKKSVIKIPKIVASHMANITIGTARGAMHAKTENTPFNIYHIPLFDISRMVKKDVTIGFSKKTD